MKKIEIESSQNVVIQFQLASVFERIAAYLIDLAIVFFISRIIWLIIEESILFGESSENIASIISSVIILTYQFIMEAFVAGRSVGKMAMKIMPVSKHGTPLTITECITRWVFRLPDILLTLGLLATAMIHAGRHAQRLGDMIAGTVVIKQGESTWKDLSKILKMNKQQQNYQPIYPSVKQLTDQDIMLVREVIQRYESDPYNEGSIDAVNTLLSKIKERLNIAIPDDEIKFLKTIVTDYVFLTR